MKLDVVKILKFLDQNILLGLSLFLLVFIPLYPKWPMFDVLPGYNVRVRLEDFLILTTMAIWLIWVLRGKIKLKKNPLFKPILIYLGIGFLSTLSAIFITKTVTTESYQILKLYFHFFRRVEYFSLFFIFFSSIYKKEQIKLFLVTLISTIVAITTYGFGQKYLYWPAFSTMNREFSKGVFLYLTEHARVLSTFGGHYDLAAYTVLTLTIIIPLMFLVKNKWLKLLLLLVAVAEYWLLNLTASRTSFIAYLAALTITFFLLGFKKKWGWAISRWFGVVFISLAVMLTIGPLSERFSHIIQMEGVRKLAHNAFGTPPENGIPMRDDMSPEEQLGIVADKTDIPPSIGKPGRTRPLDVYIDPYEATASGRYVNLTEEEIKEIEATFSSGIHVDYSENALKYGLSTGIRLDALWPRALAAFKKNPLLGTGYSTLVKTKVWEQTTAESTDNDYLRLLGETGLLGFIAFLAIFFIAGKLFIEKFRKTDDPLYFGILASGIGVIVGLMVNALYIDVFESSKVAYTYWSLIGIILALALVTGETKTKIAKPKKKK
jgi:O-antigen ligase/polysaccharide polymerase Wzy-like membrane protein